MNTDIIDLCNKLNKAIHEPLYHNFYNISNDLKYKQTFTSIDLIEDAQLAIEEFETAESLGKDGRSTLLIYGLLQSLFLQQDGLYHLYKSIVDEGIRLKDFFNLFSFDKNIREVRNDIAGHPTDRNGSKEFYYIVKGSISEDNFTYAGYSPKFTEVEVDLKEFVTKQETFTKNVLLAVEANIRMKITLKKNEHKNRLLAEMMNDIDRYVQLIYRGVTDEERNFQTEQGISGLKIAIDEISKELKKRYNKVSPYQIPEPFRMIDYILLRLKQWWNDNTLLNNNDTEIFLDSLEKQLKELKGILSQIDKEFLNE